MLIANSMEMLVYFIFQRSFIDLLQKRDHSAHVAFTLIVRMKAGWRILAVMFSLCLLLHM